MRARNTFTAVFLLAFGLWYAYLTTHLTVRTLEGTPGPSFFPWVLTVCLFLLTGVLLIQGLMPGASEPRPASGDFAALIRPGTGLLFMAAYLAGLPFIGFLLLTPVFFVLFMWTLGERRPVWLSVFSVGVPVFLHLLFQKVFVILLPAGIILD